MSAGLRRYRARIYAYTDGGAGGAVASTYTPVLSGDPDGDWWCSRGVPSGRERTLAGAAEHSIDAVFGFARDVLLTDNGLLVSDGVQYLVRSIQPRMVGLDEIAVYVERTADAFVFVDDPGETLPTPEIAVTSSIAATAVVGTSPPPLAVPVGNSTGPLVLLGVVTASLVTPVSWASVVYAAGVATLTYTTAAEPVGTYTMPRSRSMAMPAQQFAPPIFFHASLSSHVS